MVVHADLIQNLPCDISRLSPTLDDDLGMNSRINQFLGLSQELAGQYRHSGGTIADLLVLRARDVYQYLGCWIVDEYGLKYCRAVICDSDLLIIGTFAHGLEDLVHAFRTESGLDQVGHGDRANERLLQEKEENGKQTDV